ncbi:MAG: VCBS repeat-containing protein [Planctomycetota bacterium]
MRDRTYPLTSCLLILAFLSPLTLAQDLERIPDDPFHFEHAPRFTKSGETPRPLGYAVASLDIDDDGDLDSVNVHNFRQLEVFENRNGRFVLRQSEELTAFGGGQFKLETGDFDGDGVQDVALAGFKFGEFKGLLWIYERDIRGRLVVRHQFETSASIPFLAVGDVDGDGHEEAIVADRRENSLVEIFSPLTPPRSFDAGFVPTGLDAGDLTGDGFAEIVLIHSGAAHVRYNDGTGAFPTSAEFGSGLWIVRIGDANDDGIPDVVGHDAVAIPGQERVDILAFLNDGTGNLQTIVRSPLLQSFWAAKELELGDLDGDGRTDLAVSFVVSSTGTPSGIVTTAKGTGSGAFTLQRSLSVRLEDFDLIPFEHPDRLVIVGAERQVVPIDEEGRVGGLVLRSYSTNFLPESAIFDTNADGLDDLVAFDGASQVQTFLSDGEGGFPIVKQSPLFGLSVYARLFPADLDGLGAVDLISVSPQEITGLIGDGQGGFTAISSQPLPHCSGCAAWFIAVGDLSGDGLTDVSIGDKRTNQGLLAVADGSGAFVFVPWTYAEVPGHPVIADLTGDGNLDIVYNARSGFDTLILHAGRGDGTFDPVRRSSLPITLAAWASAGDLDGDGDLDLVYSQPGGIATLINDGAGNFTVGQAELGAPAAYDDHELIDLDDDGDLDVVSTFQSDRLAVAMFENRNGRLVESRGRVEMGANGILREFRKSVGDLDGDRRPDLVVTMDSVAPSAPDMWVYFNRSSLRYRGKPFAGETVTLDLSMPEARVRSFQLLASLRGTWPGIVTPSGTRLPLNFDPNLFQIIFGGGAGIFVGFSGTFDDFGRAEATLDIPQILPIAAPISLDFAFYGSLGGGRVKASNAQPITIR